MTRAWAAWERFWFEPLSTATLVLVRTAFGLLVFLWALSALPDATALFGPDGVLAASSLSVWVTPMLESRLALRPCRGRVDTA